ncbi:MAG: UrcA family protein [Sphingopyxis sp.]
MKSSLAVLLPSLLSLTLVIAAVPAVAEPVSGLEPTRVNVDYSDLDLSRAAGVATLAVRVRSAIKRACPEMTNELRQQVAARKCRAAATARANEATEIAIASARAGSPRLASGTERPNASLQN